MGQVATKAVAKDKIVGAGRSSFGFSIRCGQKQRSLQERTSVCQKALPMGCHERGRALVDRVQRHRQGLQELLALAKTLDRLDNDKKKSVIKSIDESLEKFKEGLGASQVHRVQPICPFLKDNDVEMHAIPSGQVLGFELHPKTVDKALAFSTNNKLTHGLQDVWSELHKTVWAEEEKIADPKPNLCLQHGVCCCSPRVKRLRLSLSLGGP